MEKISLIFKEFGVFVLVGVIGVGVIFLGMWGVMGSEKATVEIVKGDGIGASNIGTSNIGTSNIGTSNIGEENEIQIVVDLAGAVEKPGVYKLPSGSRIGDVLVMGGGLASGADREWVAKTLNLAEVVEDGEKVYIPSREVNSNIATSNLVIKEGQKSGKVNINTASLAQLDGLEGIGGVRAKLIMDNRPYSKIDDLVSKAKIPESVYEKIKGSVTIY